MGISIVLNGEQKELGESIRLNDLLLNLDLKGKRIAIDINNEIIKRSEIEMIELKDQDKIEIIEAVGGG